MGASAKISADLNFNDEVFYIRLNTIYQEVLAKEK